MLSATRERSWVWVLLPILFSVVGGVISYFALRNDDPHKARICLFIGIIFTVTGLLYYGIVFFILR